MYVILHVTVIAQTTTHKNETMTVVMMSVYIIISFKGTNSTVSQLGCIQLTDSFCCPPTTVTKGQEVIFENFCRNVSF